MKKKYLLLAGVLLFLGCASRNGEMDISNNKFGPAPIHKDRDEGLADSVYELAKRDGVVEIVGFRTTPPQPPIQIVKNINITQVVEATDSDLDGVPDIKDKCPNTPPNLQVNPEGCPVLTTIYIQFDPGKAEVKKIYYPYLKKVAEILKANPKLKIEVDGYTDDRGNKNVNKVLSLKRAEAVKNILVHKFHIKASRIVTKGYGSSNPLVPNTTPTNRALNRRVEIVALNNNYEIKEEIVKKENNKIENSREKKIEEIKSILNDNDLDGIPDDIDLCPNTPLNTKVNAQGCEIFYTFNIDPKVEPNPNNVKVHYQEDVDKIANLLKKYPKMKIEIIGYTDNSGTPKYRLSFSTNIAKAIREVLIEEYHFKPERITAKGLAEAFPVAPNTSLENRLKNFRVEVVAQPENEENSAPQQKNKKREVKKVKLQGKILNAKLK